MIEFKKGMCLVLALAFVLLPMGNVMAAGVPTIDANKKYAFLKDVETKIIEKTNQKRKENGKATLTTNALLTRSAEYKSLYPMMYTMSNGDVYKQHPFATGPAKLIDENVTDAAQLLEAGRLSRDMFGLVDGENLAYSSGFAESDAEAIAEAFVSSWMNSAPHKEALLSNDWKSIGVGVTINELGIMCIQHYSKGNPTSGDAVPNPMVSNQGNSNGWFKRTNGKWSYASNGELATGWTAVGGKWFYLNSLGILQTGWIEVDNKWYFMDSDGAMQVGWTKVGNDWFYLNKDGSRAFGKIEVGGHTYLLDGTTGIMKTGWLMEGGKYYMYRHQGGSMVKGWYQDNGRWYYMNENGVMQTGWQHIQGKWYYLSGSGAMALRWARIDGKWYYLGNNGAMRTGWQKVGSKWYFFKNSGVMQIGWQYDKGRWYYLDGSGAMKTGWMKEGSRWYYLYPSSGVMATGRVTIGGKVNRFSSSGVWQGY